MPRYAQITAGDPAPSFHQRSAQNPRYAFDTAAGRYIVLCILGSAGHPAAAAAIRAAQDHAGFDDDRACCFFVTADPADESGGRIAGRIPGLRVFWDADLTVARLYGAAPLAPDTGPYLPRWVVIDPQMRVIEVLPFAADGGDIGRLVACLAAQPPIGAHTGQPVQAPILYLPRVFEPDLCRRLIELYDAQGGELSGFMREVDGRTVGINDSRHKARRDVLIEDQGLIGAVQERFRRRVIPEIAKAHQFHVTRMERYLVGCYTAEDGGHFAAHRDNTTAGTAHRRFAVSVNLNTDFEGGEVSFPEYGRQGFKAPAGGAVVFSCSLLHAVSRVTAGRRYAFLPFLYDDAAARLRDANRHLVGQAQSEPAGAQMPAG
ncbi:MAG: 2OG-Fe(II) oxygenase [Paracoccaceae bacterium]|nr:MAG: 2OG-Fe(II) oxygenase [Paracoccaceae bacterium]